MIQTASGSGLGFGTPLTKRSGWVVHAVLSTVVLRAMTWSAFPKWTCSGVSIEMPPCLCSALYQRKNDRQNVLAWP